MDNEEGNEIKKPGCTFTILLFIFFYLLVRYILQVFNFYSWNGINPLKNEFSLTAIISTLPGVVAALYFAFAAIYKSLQCKIYSIAMLKYAAIYFLCNSILDIYHLEYRFLYAQLIFIVPKILFYIIFLIYLYRSKDLNTYLPKETRKAAKVHWIAMLIFLISIAPTCYITGVQFYKAYVSMPVNKNQLNLSDEELSDGLAVFSPLDSWELDTIYQEQKNVLHIFKSEENLKSYVTTLNTEYQSRIEFSALLSEFKGLSDSLYVDKLLSKDTIINENKLLYDIYKYRITKGGIQYWTFAAMYSSDFLKTTIISCFEKDTLNKSESSVLEFMKSVDFNLEPWLKNNRMDDVND